MLYSDEKNIDYINMKLKRLATEDEIQVLNSLWTEMLPYRYLKSFYKRRFSKNIFSEKIHKNVKVKNHCIAVKPSSRIYGEKTTMNSDCLKDIVAMGMKPNAISILTSQDNIEELNNIADYYNTAGVPVTNVLYDTKNGETQINSQNIPKRTDIFCLSLKKNRKIKKQKIKNGYNIIIIGSETVKEEGIITDSFMQKKLIDASMEIVQKDISSASKTCNEGLFSAIVKMIKDKNFGIFINIDNLHKKAQHSTAWEALTASTPERLIFAVKDWKLVEFIKVVDKYEIPFSIIGKIDKTGSVKVVHKGNLVISLPKKLIFNPLPKVNNADYEPLSVPKKKDEISINNDSMEKVSNNEIFTSSYDKFKTFDSLIGNKTSLYKTENGISELWYEDIKHYISTALHTMHLQFDFDPFIAGENLVNEAVRKIVAMGHKPVAISIICCLNFSKQGEVSRFELARKGIFQAVKKLKIKLLNLDVTNDDNLSSVSILAIGKAKKSNKILVPYFNNNQNVYLIGKTDNTPSTSLFQAVLGKSINTKPDTVDYKLEKKLRKLIKKLQKESLIASCISIDRFGIIGALHKTLRANKLGFEFFTPPNDFLLNELQSRYLISSNQDLFNILKKSKIPFAFIGKTNNSGEVTYK